MSVYYRIDKFDLSFSTGLHSEFQITGISIYRKNVQIKI